MHKDVFVPLVFLPWVVVGANDETHNASRTVNHSCRDGHGNEHYACNISRILAKILDGYDKRLRPYSDAEEPVLVKVGLWILSIDSINVMDMEYRIDLFLRQTWNDPRLRNSYPDKLTVSNTLREKIWVPDTYFENSKRSEFHFVTVPNIMLRITQDGTIELNTRLSVVASCHMDLRMYPADKQTCYLHIHSYGYSTKDITYEWEGTSRQVHVESDAKFLPQYNVSQFRPIKAETKTYVAGNWSGLSLSFKLERLSGHFYLHMYATCIMIVILSWISFFIPREVIVARVGLGMSSVLTVAMIFNTQETAMPKVAYIKLADWYLIASLLFVVSVLVEYTIVLYLIAKQAQNEEKAKKEASAKLQPPEIYVMNGDAKQPLLTKRIKRDPKHGIKKVDDCETNIDDGENVEYSIRRTLDYYPCCAEAIDRQCRTLFPLAFVCFNTIYWIYYFTHGSF